MASETTDLSSPTATSLYQSRLQTLASESAMSSSDTLHNGSSSPTGKLDKDPSLSDSLHTPDLEKSGIVPCLEKGLEPTAHRASEEKTMSALEEGFPMPKEIIDDEGIDSSEGLNDAFGPPPDGGLQAWLVVVGAGMIAFCGFGMVASSGAFVSYYAKLTGYSVSTTSWIGSCAAFLTFFLSIFCGSFFDHHGPRKLLICGGLVQVVALMLISLCTEFWQLILAHGVMLPLGLCNMMVVPLGVTNQWFAKRKGLAVGIVMGCSSWGAIIWPEMIAGLPSKVGWGWTVRIIGFVQLLMIGGATCLLKTRLPPKASAPLFHWKAFSFSKPAYLYLTISSVTFTWGFFYFLFYIASYATEYGYTENAPYLLIICNASSGFGRMGSGFLADKFGRFNVATAGILFAALAMFLWQLCHTYGSMIAIAIVYGFFSGGNISLQPVCVAQIAEDPRLIGSLIGMILGAQSFAALLGSPISGFILGTTAESQFKNFKYGIALNGGMLALGAIFFGLARYTLDKRLFAKV